MATKKSKTPSKREIRSIRIQQIIFFAIGLIVIISMVISLVAN